MIRIYICMWMKKEEEFYTQILHILRFFSQFPHLARERSERNFYLFRFIACESCVKMCLPSTPRERRVVIRLVANCQPLALPPSSSPSLQSHSLDFLTPAALSLYSHQDCGGWDVGRTSKFGRKSGKPEMRVVYHVLNKPGAVSETLGLADN